MRKAAFCTILLTVAMFLLGALPAAAASAYTCKDLGVNTGANALNQAGQVVGNMYTPSGNHAFLYSGGVKHDLGTLQAPYNYSSYAKGINAAGQVVGSSYTSSSGAHAFLWSSGGGMVDLGTPLGPDDKYYAYGINAAGQVAGYRIPSSGSQQAFLYSGGGMQNLGTLPISGASDAKGINDAGQVVGGSGHAYLYSGAPPLQDLGTLNPGVPAIASWANAVNAIGQVVGTSYTTVFIYHAFLWSGGVMQDLGTLPGSGSASEAYGIDTAGQVVGWSDTATSGDPIPHAFLYSDGVMHDLNNLVQNLPAGDVLAAAYGINDRGQIIAQGSHGHSYLLTPGPPVGALDLLLLE
ncbi:MAG: HAF repeat-containing protein [Deltaproteobacteria bacterium]|nr:HAF repeat-containing protein [Deltaproteobacteria bacterium]